MSQKEYKVPLNVVAQTLSDGSVVAPGERVKLSDEEVRDEFNAGLFAEGKLIPVSDQGQEVVDKAVDSHQRQVSAQEEEQAEAAGLPEPEELGGERQ